jgi:hypothetical protein
VSDSVVEVRIAGQSFCLASRAPSVVHIVADGLLLVEIGNESLEAAA